MNVLSPAPSFFKRSRKRIIKKDPPEQSRFKLKQGVLVEVKRKKASNSGGEQQPKPRLFIKYIPFRPVTPGGTPTSKKIPKVEDELFKMNINYLVN